MAEQPFEKRTGDEQAIDEEVLKEYLRDVLDDANPAIPKFADLPSAWRDAPDGEPDPDHSDFFNRAALLRTYIGIAETAPWAREGLRSLLRELRESGEDVPAPLVWWAVDQCVQGDPPPKRGRPEAVDRDFRVWVAHGALRSFGYRQDVAVAYIADLMSRPEETVRSMIRKLGKHIRESQQGI